MGLFDFLKPKLKPQPGSFDELFDLASKDPAYRPLFYQRLLEIDLFVLIDANNNLPKGNFVADGNTQLTIRMLSDGTVPVFTSESKIYDNGVTREQAHYAAMKGAAFFSMFPNPPRMWLNPYSHPSKELLPEEIRQLKTGQLYPAGKKKTLTSGSILQISIPSPYPSELVAALKRYAATRDEIQELHVAMLNNTTLQDEPHLVIGIKAARHTKQIINEISEVIKSLITQGSGIDLFDLSRNSSLSKVLKDKQFCIYQQ